MLEGDACGKNGKRYLWRAIGKLYQNESESADVSDRRQGILGGNIFWNKIYSCEFYGDGPVECCSTERAWTEVL